MGLYNVINRALMQSGQPEDISQIVANLDAIAAVLNGGLDNSNVNAAAAIDYSKLNVPASAIPVTKLTPGANTQVLTTVAGVAAWAAVAAANKQLIKVTQLFNGTVSYTPTAGTTAMFVECIGAGGGGAGALDVNNNVSVGGGGGGGAYACKWCTAFTAGAITVAIGAGGTVGAQLAGNNGGDTTFDAAVANVVAKGGLGAPVAVLAGLAGSVGKLGGAGGPAGTSVGDIKESGQPGGGGFTFTNQLNRSGWGGMAGGPGGGGGQEVQNLATALSTAGIVGGNYGGGGSGGVNGAGGVQAGNAGGAGAPGLIRVWEFA